MAATAHSVEVAVGALGRTSGFPNPAGETWVPFGVEESFAEFFGVGEDPVADVVLTGALPNSYSPPTVPNPINTTSGTIFGAAAGEKIRRWVGEALSMRFPIYNIDGTSFATHLAHPAFQLLASVMGYVIPGADVDTVDGNAANAYTFTPTNAADYELGQIVSVTRNGMVEYARVTGIASGPDLITVHPHWEGGALTNGMTVRHHFTFFPTTGDVTEARECHVRFKTGTRVRYMFRCVVSEFTLEEVPDSANSGGGAFYLTIVIRPGSKTMLSDNANAGTPVAYTPTGTGVATPLQACNRRSSALVSTYSAPGHGAATSWPLKKYSLNVKFNLSGSGGSCDPILREAGVTRGRELLALSFDSADGTTYDRAMADGEERTFVLGAGPADEGFCFMLNTGHLAQTEKPGLDPDNDEVEIVSGVLRQGAWALDTGAGDAKNKAWCWGFPIPTP